MPTEAELAIEEVQPAGAPSAQLAGCSRARTEGAEESHAKTRPAVPIWRQAPPWASASGKRGQQEGRTTEAELAIEEVQPAGAPSAQLAGCSPARTEGKEVSDGKTRPTIPTR
jgi:hypothetical protein